MSFLHSELDLKTGEVIQVTLDNQANVMLMDRSNFDAYRRGQTFRYFGGHAKHSPVRLVAPGAGKWHVVVDLGGFAGTVRAGISTFRDNVATRP